MASHTFVVPITDAMVGSSTLAVFARDRSNVQTADLGGITVIAVHGPRTRAVALASAVRDLVYDAKRARLYVSLWGMDQVEVLDPVTAPLGTPIPPPATPDRPQP